MMTKAEEMKLAKKQIILKKALEHFSRYDFEEVSLREIAAEIGISVGNLYNYFKNKDALFEAVLEPFLQKVAIVKKFLLTHSDENNKQECEEDFLAHLALAQKIAKFVHKNRQMISILLFHSKGSSLEQFSDNMINFQTKRFHKEINQKAGSPVFDIFFAHNLVSYFYNTIREALMHDLDLQQLKQATKEMITFAYLGIMGTAEQKVASLNQEEPKQKKIISGFFEQ